VVLQAATRQEAVVLVLGELVVAVDLIQRDHQIQVAVVVAEIVAQQEMVRLAARVL